MGFQVDEKNLEILEMTMQEFQKNGLKFTLNDIASSMHIAKKTIYQYYASKEDLLIGLLDYGFSEIHEKKRMILASDLPPAEKLKEAMIAMPDQYQLLDFRMLSTLSEKYPRAASALKDHLESDWEPIVALIEEGISKGIFRDISVAVLKTMFTASLEAFLSTEVLQENGISYQEALEDMMTVIMGGIVK